MADNSNDNFIMLSENIYDSAYIVTDNGNEEPLMKLDYLKDERRSVFYRSLNSGATILKVQKSSEQFTHIAIVDNNYHREQSVVQANFNVIGWQDGFSVGPQDFNIRQNIRDLAPTFFNALMGDTGNYKGVDQENYLLPPLVIHTGLQTSKYINIQISTAPLNSYHQFSRVFISDAIQPSKNIDASWSILSQANSISRKTIGGTVYKNSKTNITRVTFSTKFVTESEQLKLFVRKLKYGKRKNIILQMRPNSPNEDKDYMVYYGKIVNETYRPDFLGNTIVDFVFEESM